jgi:3-hydroxy-9,10-secoandrosta-1,3,5(10)-triene-9,17-dione monooxygenase reductase component
MRPCPPVDLAAETPLPEHDVPGVEAEVFREAMRRVASPVVVVTAHPKGAEPRGATIGSFTSVALEPPLVSFNVTHGTRLHATLKATRRFAVHLLAADQAEMADHFADPDLSSEAQFRPYAHTLGADGAPPLLDGSLGVLRCVRERCIDAGDHAVFIGRVYEVVPGRDRLPLLYYAREYGTIERGRK